MLAKGGALALLLAVSSCSSISREDRDWNHLGIWKQVAGHPPTYVPGGYAGAVPSEQSPGTWFQDHRDGKRLFVPKSGTPGYSAATLEGEAIKVTTSFAAQESKSAAKAFLLTPVMLPAMFADIAERKRASLGKPTVVGTTQ